MSLVEHGGAASQEYKSGREGRKRAWVTSRPVCRYAARAENPGNS